MRISDFLEAVANGTRQALPDTYQNFKSRQRGSMVQIWYGRPQIHYEVWVQGGRNRLEVGLHFEASKPVNDRLIRYLAQRFIGVQASIGPNLELEQWTHNWGRVHQFVAYDKLDEELTHTVATELAQMITTLEPLYVPALD